MTLFAVPRLVDSLLEVFTRFDEDQPRHPAGSPGGLGGQFVADGAPELDPMLDGLGLAARFADEHEFEGSNKVDGVDGMFAMALMRDSSGRWAIVSTRRSDTVDTWSVSNEDAGTAVLYPESADELATAIDRVVAAVRRKPDQPRSKLVEGMDWGSFLVRGSTQNNEPIVDILTTNYELGVDDQQYLKERAVDRGDLERTTARDVRTGVREDAEEENLTEDEVDERVRDAVADELAQFDKETAETVGEMAALRQRFTVRFTAEQAGTLRDRLRAFSAEPNSDVRSYARHLPGQHVQQDHAGGGVPGVDPKLDKLKLAGRIETAALFRGIQDAFARFNEDQLRDDRGRWADDPSAIVRKAFTFGGTPVAVIAHDDDTRTLDFGDVGFVRLSRGELRKLRSLAFEPAGGMRLPGGGWTEPWDVGQTDVLLRRVDLQDPSGGQKVRSELLVGIQKVGEAPEREDDETWGQTPLSVHLPPNSDPSYEDLFDSLGVRMQLDHLARLAEQADELVAERIDTGKLDVFRDGGRYVLRHKDGFEVRLDSKSLRSLYKGVSDLYEDAGREPRPATEVAERLIATNVGDVTVRMTGEGVRVEAITLDGAIVIDGNDHVRDLLLTLDKLVESAGGSRRATSVAGQVRHKLRARLRDFDPLQPRDGDSRWTDGLLASLGTVGSLGAVHFDDDRYFDWATRRADGGFGLEIGDGAPGGNVVQMDMSRDDLTGLHAALTEALAGEDPGQFKPGDAADRRYFDWSDVEFDEDGTEFYTFEAGLNPKYEGDERAVDGETVVVEMARPDMGDLHAALTMTLLSEEGVEEPLLRSLQATGYLGGTYFDDDDYVDWSTRRDDGSYGFEAGNGIDGMAMDLMPEELVVVHEALTRGLGHGTEDRFTFHDGDLREVRWEPLDVHGESWEVEFTGEDGVSVAFDWPVVRLQHLHAALTASLLAEDLGIGVRADVPDSRSVGPSSAGETGPVQRKFNPAQPRDDEGQWTDTGVASLWNKVTKFGFKYSVVAAGQPESGFAVSTDPKRAKKSDTRSFTAGLLREYRDANQDLLSSKDHFIGVWRERDDTTGLDRIWLDVNAVYQDRQAAATAARDAGQKTVFDLSDGGPLDLGGEV